MGTVGTALCAGVYPLATTVGDCRQANKEDALPGMLSVYVTLEVFLLLSARNPSPNRSVIAIAAWASFAQGAAMAVLAS